MTGVDRGLRRALCGPVTVQEARLQTSDCSKEMDDLVTGQRPSAHLFPGEESGTCCTAQALFLDACGPPASEHRCTSGMARSSRLLADRWRGRWGGGGAGAGSICERHQKNLIFVFNTDNKRLSFAVAEKGTTACLARSQYCG